jgi:hypothetical protein
MTVFIVVCECFLDRQKHCFYRSISPLLSLLFLFSPFLSCLPQFEFHSGGRLYLFRRRQWRSARRLVRTGTAFWTKFKSWQCPFMEISLPTKASQYFGWDSEIFTKPVNSVLSASLCVFQRPRFLSSVHAVGRYRRQHACVACQADSDLPLHRARQQSGSVPRCRVSVR